MAFPDIGKAGSAVQRVFRVLDRKPAIDAFDPSGETLSALKGKIEFRDVGFAYPVRPDVRVFRCVGYSARTAFKRCLLVHVFLSSKLTEACI